MIQTSEIQGEGTTEVLWNELSRPLRRFLRARTGTDADADDLLQEVFVRVHRQLSTLRTPERLQSWVYQIARNAVIDHYRTRRTPTDRNTELLPDEAPTNDPVDLTPTLRRFVANLPQAYREPIELHEFRGMPLVDVAKCLGLSLTAAKSRVRRGRLMLRKMLDQCCRFEFDRRGRVIEATPRARCECSNCPDEKATSLASSTVAGQA
jgi:RNA polymerase sigma-70 factor (ECF subfamily)